MDGDALPNIISLGLKPYSHEVKSLFGNLGKVPSHNWRIEF
jgi:hypothetical protein